MNPKDKGARPSLEVLTTRNRMGDVLRHGREQAQLTPEAAAELLTISVKNLIEAEKGLTEIPLQVIFAAANTYNIDPSLILEVIQEINMADADSSEKLERLSRLKI